MTESVLLAIAAAGIGASVAYLVHLFREKGRARRAHASVAQPHLTLSAELDGELAEISGVLGSNSPGLAAVTTSRFTTDPLATTSRAADLHLAVGNDIVAIDGPVEVVLGSEEISSYLSSNLIIGSRRGLTRTLRPGDVVVASGKLNMVGEFSGYRRSDQASWSLAGAGDGGHPGVALTSLRAPRASAVDRRHLVVGASLGLCLLLFASTGNDSGRPQRTAKFLCQARIAPTPELPMIGAANADQVAPERRPAWLPESIVCSSAADPNQIISLDLSGEEAWKITSIPRTVSYDAGLKARLGFGASLGRVASPKPRLSQQLLLPLLFLRSPGLQ